MFCEHSIEIIKVVCFFYFAPGTSPDRNAAPFTRETDTHLYKNPPAHSTVPTGCKVTDDSPNKQKSAAVFYEIFISRNIPHFNQTSFADSMKGIHPKARRPYQRQMSEQDENYPRKRTNQNSLNACRF